MKYQAENTVSSFFYYMWNAWSEEECKTVYGVNNNMKVYQKII